MTGIRDDKQSNTLTPEARAEQRRLISEQQAILERAQAQARFEENQKKLAEAEPTVGVNIGGVKEQVPVSIAEELANPQVGEVLNAGLAESPSESPESLSESDGSSAPDAGDQSGLSQKSEEVSSESKKGKNRQ